MPIPFAALAAALARGGGAAAGGAGAKGAAAGAGAKGAAGAGARGGQAASKSFGPGSVDKAQATTTQKGNRLRDAMELAGGDKDLAKEMMSQQDKQAKEEDRRARQQERDAAKNNNGLIQRIMRDPLKGAQEAALTGVDRSKDVIQDRYRGAAVDTLDQMGMKFPAKLLDALGKLTDAIVERGEALSPYSGELATSKAMSRVRQLQADIYEANQAGGSYAKVMDEQSKLQTSLQTAFVPMKDEIAKLLGQLLEMLGPIMALLGPQIKIWTAELKLINFMLQKILWIWRNLTPAGIIAEFAQEMQKQEQKKQEPKNYFQELLRDAALNLPPDGGVVAQDRRGGNNGLGMGIFDGL